jgi:iron complex outermembrane receptor protein
MFRIKRTRRIGIARCAASLALCACIQQVSAQPAAPQLERVEVTGSNIKRINAESTAPVEVITREQIVRSGQPTVADLLRNLSANSGGSFGESFSNSFAPGAAGISLRGLGQKTTLVLLNGRRVTGYGFAQNLQETFVDLNAIPSSAVERVDILKDGASAIYGSDAIAGVVNIILRRDYKGVEVGGSGAIGGDSKGEHSFSVIGGTGDLSTDKFNVFGVLDYYKRDELLMSDTKFGATRDMRNYAGGRNFNSLTAGGTWRQLSPTNALTNVFQAIAGCTGTVMTGPEALAAGLITPANAAQGAAGNTFCTQATNQYLSALPATERIGFTSRGLYQLSPTTSAFGEFGLNRNTTTQTFTNPFFAGSVGLTPIDGGLQPFTYNINFAPGVAGNPFGTNARYTGSLNDLGTRNADITSDTLRAVGGLRYAFGDWDMESAVGLSKNKAESLFSNRITLSGTSAVFHVPTTPQPPIPTSTESDYDLHNPSNNSAAVRDLMRANFTRAAKSQLSFIDTKGSTEISSWQLPGGPVGLAVGAEYRREKLQDRPAEVAASGNIIGQGITATDGQRSNSAVYAEFALPLTKQLEAQVAARRDQYSDYGSSTTPKIGMKYTPSSELAFRANWGKGFRAPTLPEISPSVATFFTTVNDPQDGVARQISGVYAGNPNLKAETSRSTALGFVLEPNKNFNISVDVYKLTWNNVVEAPDFQDVLDASCDVDRDLGTDPDCPEVDGVITRDSETNQVTIIHSNYQNLESRKVSGVDFDARLTLPTETSGRFRLGGKLAYVRSFKESGEEVAGSNGGANTIPRIKASLALDWDSGPWAVTYTAHYTHSYHQELLASSYFTPQASTFQNGVYPERVPSYSTYDLFVGYEVNKNLSMSASVMNLFDRTPPYDPGFSATYLYDFSLYDVRGRQLRVNFKYKL